MTASPSGLSAALLPTQCTLCGSEPKAFPVGKGTQCPFSAPQEQGSSPALAFPRQPWLGLARACHSMEPSWGRAVSWFCNLAIGIPHHNIMDKREELHIPEDLKVREHTSRKIHHLVARSLFHFCLLPGRGVGVLSKPCAFIK